MPPGTYEVTVTVPEEIFAIRHDSRVAQTLRVDIGLEVGSTTDTVTVTESASLLRTESGDLSHNVTSDTWTISRY